MEKIKEARDLLLTIPCNKDNDTNKFLIAEIFTELGICVDPIKQSSIQFQTVLEFLQSYQGHLKKIIDSTNIISIGFAIGFVIIESYHLSLILTDENELVQRLDAMIDNLNILIKYQFQFWISEKKILLENFRKFLRILNIFQGKKFCSEKLRPEMKTSNGKRMISNSFLKLVLIKLLNKTF